MCVGVFAAVKLTDYAMTGRRKDILLPEFALKVKLLPAHGSRHWLKGLSQ